MTLRWIAFFAFVFLGGGALAPWVYKAVLALSGPFPVLQGLAEEPFRRYLNRCLLVLALIGLWPFLKHCGYRRVSDLGFKTSPAMWSQWAVGFAIGFVSFLIAVVTALAAGAHRVRTGLGPLEVADIVLGAALTAAVVSVIEETLFRGGLFQSLAKEAAWPKAAFASAAVYAAAHFFDRPDDPDAIDWRSGYVALMEMTANFTRWDALLPAFLNLLLAGCVLALGFQRTGALWLPIGVHAGWIFWSKCFRKLTAENPDASLRIWGGRDLIDGWLVFAILLATLVALARVPILKRGPRTG